MFQRPAFQLMKRETEPPGRRRAERSACRLVQLQTPQTGRPHRHVAVTDSNARGSGVQYILINVK